METAPGTRMGSYEILAPIGAGGMGEVYRARDTKLGREVAIKLLPDAFGADPERLARFEREARVLAALNHPGIAHLYGFESTTLEHGGKGHFLVMELASGEDLAQRMKRGPLPVSEVLAIARQIAEALEEAHERGIVHRDLKPANVMLAADGKVKVLDFGLAKAYASDVAAGVSSDMSQSPTLAAAGTMAGMILGTAAYMSPEQARGKPIDRRADIWAFGVLLYEMLTGTRLFNGETVSDTLAAVLRQEVAWGTLPGATPGSVKRLLERCLDRDPRSRLRDIGEARVALESAGSAREDGEMRAAVARAPARWPLIAAVGVSLLLGLLAGRLLWRPPDRAPAVGQRWALALPDGMTLSTAEYPQLAISNDGRSQVMVVVDEEQKSRLLVRRDDEFEPRILPDTERASGPFFSPDGAWIGFFRDGALFKIPAMGGPPVRLAATSGQIRGGTWGKDGFVYFAPDTNSPLFRVPDTGGEAKPVTEIDESRFERTHRWPSVLPGGAVLYTSDTQSSTEYYDDARIEVVRPATGEHKALVEGSSQAWYAPSGHLLFARAGSIYAVPLDLGSLEVAGSPVLVIQGVATDVGSGAVQLSIARSGAALWAPGGITASYQVVWVDRDNAEMSAPVPPAPYNELALSPDGRRLALVGGQGGVSDLWIADLEREGMTRLTFGEYVTSPVWTPDGAQIAYGSRVQGTNTNTWRIAMKPADGSREAVTLLEEERGRTPTSFSPDGRMLLYAATTAEGTKTDIWMLPVNEPREPTLIIGGPFSKSEGSVSPDGRWLAYVSDENGPLGVFVRPFPSGEGRWQISTPTGNEPRWSHDGGAIFYRASNDLYRVPVSTAGGFRPGRPERLFDRVASGTGIPTYAPGPDGKRIMTFRSAEPIGSRRAVYLDLGFGSRIASLKPAS